jgi:hypothetical protein
MRFPHIGISLALFTLGAEINVVIKPLPNSNAPARKLMHGIKDTRKMIGQINAGHSEE